MIDMQFLTNVMIPCKFCEGTRYQSEILKAFERVLSTKPTLKLELKKINLKPVIEVKEEESPSLIEMAKDVFGA